ncbi:hypothetical protein BDW22DRAFT_1425007 [Trametopsis cervina]|nr:hypothetical protein BDW22DRAFT_1425007 [Trametopsis cervina]
MKLLNIQSTLQFGRFFVTTTCKTAAENDTPLSRQGLKKNEGLTQDAKAKQKPAEARTTVRPRKASTRLGDPVPRRVKSAPDPGITLGHVEHVAYYSCDSSDNISFDHACQRVFRQPSTVPFDLYKGRYPFYRKNKDNTIISGRLFALGDLSRACVVLGQEDKLRNADVVTWKAILVKLMLGISVKLQFYSVNGILHVTEYYRGSPFTQEKLKAHLISGYHGYAFEQLCTAPKGVQGFKFQLPSLGNRWTCIVGRQLGDMNILFGGEVDCVKERYDKTSSSLMELKTERIINDATEGEDCRFEHTESCPSINF